jgi:predicted metalloendopeptidase
MSRSSVFLALAMVSLAASAGETATATLTSGIDMTAMDKGVRPQDDLFRYVNGTWLANTPFPAEYASAGIGIMLFEKAQDDVHAILLEAAAAGDAATPEMHRLGDMYTSFMDEKRVEESGIAPLAPLFAEINAIDGPQALAGFFGTAQGRGISVPIGIYVSPDARNSTHNIAYLTQDGLGMPNRDYYLREDDTYKNFRSKYAQYLAKLFTLAGQQNGAERAAKILGLETEIARAQWTPVENRDPI